MRRTAILLAHAVVGWAWCGALVGVGRQLFSMDATLILHAVGAPIGFAILSWAYHRFFGYTRPLITALVFTVVVILLDVFVVAMVFERSFDMFRSPLGTWIPFALNFAATWGVGARVPTR